MKKKQPYTSVGKLTLLISTALLIVWFFTILSTTYTSLQENQQRDIESLSYESYQREKLSNHRFDGATHDVKSLADRYSLYHYSPVSEMLFKTCKSRFIPIDSSICIPPDLLKKNLNFIQNYGISGQTYYLDSFILDRRYGITLLPPDEHSTDYFTNRNNALWEFPSIATYDSIYWSKPEYVTGAGWVVSVAESDSHEVFTGITVKLNDLLSGDYPVSGAGISLWLDHENRILPFSNLSEKESKNLQSLLDETKLHDGWQKIDGYLLLRQQLQGPGWQQIILYPTNGTINKMISIVLDQLPFALTILLILVIIIFFLLHRYLARPLWDIIEIIEKAGPNALSARLPENRHDELGKIAHAYNILLDTLRIQYENMENKIIERTRELIIAKQHAEQASKRKSSHLTTISHELRTPLNGALGALELLKMTGMKDNQSRLTDTASQCITSLLSIINNLLDFSRIESGQLSLHVEETEILPLLDQSIQTIQGQALSKGLTLKTFVGHKVPLYFDVDGTRLRQILVNLLGNALKFTEKGGIYLTVKRHNNNLIFAISDSGQGVSRIEKKSIFKPFFQGQGHIQGTGLGLTISSNLAKMMGGRLELRSSSKLGTCMSFIFPLGRYCEPMPLSGKIAAPLALHRLLSAWGISCEIAQQENAFYADELCFLPGKLRNLVVHTLSGKSNYEATFLPVQPWRLKILLVDDAAINRDIIGMMLTSLGQNVIITTNAKEALIHGQKQRFDLVLMDILMPVIDGIACAQLWRNDTNNQDPDCMIMALSASTAREEITRSKQVGIQHYLTKPITLSQLANSISIAAEYQLLRDISMQEQYHQLCNSTLSINDTIMRKKIHNSLNELLTEIEQFLGCQEKTSSLLHTLKGCLGQAGMNSLVCNVIDMENRSKYGIVLSQDEITELRNAIDIILASDFN